MPRFFLNLNECGSRTIDEEGYELDQADAARSTAIKAARSIMAAEVLEGRLCLSCRIEITDADGEIILTVPFVEAVEVTGLA